MKDWVNHPLIVVHELEKHFPVRSGLFGTGGKVHALNGVSLRIGEGETLGLIGESGCGKTTLARLILRLEKPDRGRVLFEGIDISGLKGGALRGFRRKIQMIFQDPISSLNPRMPVGEIIAEPLVIHGMRKGRRDRVKELLEDVGLEPGVYDRFPHEFSGGQRQRIGIARALALNPRLIVADEPVSALDVSVAAQILELMQKLQARYRMSTLFIAHDLRMVRTMSHRIAVMYLGEIVETMPKGEFDKPLHPYTKALVEAVPVADPARRREKILLTGEVPSPLNPPSGCFFHPRCRYAEERCKGEKPVLREVGPGHMAACHFVEKING